MVIKTFWKPITGKGKTLKPTKVSPWKLSMNKPVKAFYGDSDGDGVMNMFDCQPHNKKKQGEEHEEKWSKKNEYKYLQGALVKKSESRKERIDKKMKESSNEYYREETSY
jgi:hypothetical protein